MRIFSLDSIAVFREFHTTNSKWGDKTVIARQRRYKAAAMPAIKSVSNIAVSAEKRLFAAC
jgi:hypothetical protein